MSSKSKIILSLLTMAFTIVLALYISFAWFTMIESTEPILINTGSLRVTTGLYQAEFDQVGNITKYTKIEEGDLTINLVTPGQKLSYRIIAQNNGTIPGKLSITVNDIVGDMAMLSGFKIDFIDPTNNEAKAVFLDSVEPNESDKMVILLFSDLILEEAELVQFDFDIVVTSSINSTMKNQTLLINNFIINLEQFKAEA